MEGNAELYPIYRRWHAGEVLEADGIIVAADVTQEWLLPWWLSRYQRHNAYPVTFVDFGMSAEMQKWCAERGRYVKLPVADVFVSDKDAVQAPVVARWEYTHGKYFWPCRQAWFKKPMACLLSPYRRTLWIDVDCEVLGSLEALFELCGHPSGLAIAKEQHETSFQKIIYNSGVMAFRWGLKLFETWADLCIDSNDAFPGDQNVLSQIIQDQGIEICELPLIYNWSRCSPPNPQAVILHWHGAHGKSVIAHQMAQENLAPFLAPFLEKA